MPQFTRFNGSWTITGTDTTSNVQINNHTLIVNGNLRVLGSVANVSSTNTQVTDNIITLNQGESGSGVTAVYAGFEIDRGGLPKVVLRWNESTTRWELTTDGAVYTPIVTGSRGIAGVGEDPAPQLGGNLNTQSYAIYSSTIQAIKADTNVAIKNTTVAPATLSGYNIVYAQTPNTGASGLYITNTTTQQQELITKSRAVAFSLIL